MTPPARPPWKTDSNTERGWYTDRDRLRAIADRALVAADQEFGLYEALQSGELPRMRSIGVKLDARLLASADAFARLAGEAGERIVAGWACELRDRGPDAARVELEAWEAGEFRDQVRGAIRHRLSPAYRARFGQETLRLGSGVVRPTGIDPWAWVDDDGSDLQEHDPLVSPSLVAVEPAEPSGQAPPPPPPAAPTSAVEEQDAEAPAVIVARLLVKLRDGVNAAPVT